MFTLINKLLFGELLYFVTVLDLIYKDLSRFEAGDKVFVDHNGGVARNIAGDFFLSFFVDETAEPPDVDILATGHGSFYDSKESFN